MDRRSFQQYVDRLRELSRDQLASLLDAGRALAQSVRAAEVIEKARRPHLKCPNCAGIELYRDGHASGLQRFRCRACGRTFNSLTGTPLARLRHKGKWLDYCDTLLDPATTVRRSAGQMGVHRNTTFRWRHRMLAWPKNDVQTPLQGIVESDDMYVPESHKGARRLERPAHRHGARAGKHGIPVEQVCVLVARDRDGRTHDAVMGKGTVTAARLGDHLAGALGKGVMLVTGTHAAYRAFARQHGIEHRCIDARSAEHAGADVHLHNVSGYQHRLSAWLHHFRGVATRYLDNYCGWRRAIDAQRINSSEAFLRAAVGLFRNER